MQAVDLRVLTGSVTTCALSVPVDFSLQRLVVLKIPRTTAASFTSGGIQKSQYPVSGCVQHSSTDKWGLAWTSNNNRTSLAFCVLVFKLNTFLFSFYQNICCYRSANFILEKKTFSQVESSCLASLPPLFFQYGRLSCEWVSTIYLSWAEYLLDRSLPSLWVSVVFGVCAIKLLLHTLRYVLLPREIHARQHLANFRPSRYLFRDYTHVGRMRQVSG